MGSNAEIRQRMETYRSILLVLNWIFAIVLVIFGFVLASSQYTQGIGIGVIIGSAILGIIGHFLINVGLAIPFILLNNGDILESMKGNISGSGNSPLPGSPSNTNSGSSYSLPINNTSNESTYVPSFMRQEEKSVPFVVRPKAAINKKCAKCKREVDEDCEKCPHCGNKTFE